MAIVAGLNLADELVRRPSAPSPPTAPSQEGLAADGGTGGRDGGAVGIGRDADTTETTDGDRIAARLIQEIDRALEPEP